MTTSEDPHWKQKFINHENRMAFEVLVDMVWNKYRKSTRHAKARILYEECVRAGLIAERKPC